MSDDNSIVMPSNPNDYTAQVNIDGKWHRTLMTKSIGNDWSNIQYEDNVNVYKALATGPDGKTHTVLLTKDIDGGGTPVDLSKVVNADTIPTADEETAGRIYLYTGETDATYTHGYIYENVATPSYDSTVSFEAATLSSSTIACSGSDFAAFVAEWGSGDITTITHGTLTYDQSGGLLVFVGKDSEETTVCTFQLYTQDYQDAGFTITGTLQDGDVFTFTCEITVSYTYAWNRIDVQPTPEALPDQTGNAGKFLTTNGTSASWANVSGFNPYKYSGSKIYRVPKYINGNAYTLNFITSYRAAGQVIYALSSSYWSSSAFRATAGSPYKVANKGAGVASGLPNDVKIYTEYSGDYLYFTCAGSNGWISTIFDDDGNEIIPEETTAVTPSGASYTFDYDGFNAPVGFAAGWQGGLTSYKGIKINPYTASTSSRYIWFHYVHIYTSENDFIILQIPLSTSGSVKVIRGGDKFDIYSYQGAAYINFKDSSQSAQFFVYSLFYKLDINPSTSPLTIPAGAVKVEAPSVTKVNTTATLAAADWSGGSQTITVSGVTATGVVMVAPAPASQSDYTDAGIICTTQAADSLTFTCTSTPASDLTVNVVMF